ncbi:MAG: hypothetical protein C0623_03990 [Desulfuromonas sp.]|nr:MAG: hypothetical protein C0623_03990 [Desulfuromonas sp.]
MKSLSNLIATFAKGIAHSRVALLGAMLVTALFPFLLGALLYDSIWDMRNTYFAAAAYLFLGPLVILGLILVFLGLFFFRGKEDVRLFTLDYLRDYFTNPKRFGRMRKLLFVFVFISCSMFCIFGIITYRSYNYMNTTSFCTDFCHIVMQPQKIAHANSSHSQVSCVECHIGSNAKWYEKAKISGLTQVVNVVSHNFSKPIKTPTTHLRPDRAVCEECHRPGLFHGEKLIVREKFLPDENNTNVKTVILFKIGTAGDRTVSPHGYHWHVAPENRLVYTATDFQRTDIPIVRFKESSDSEKIFTTVNADALVKKNKATLLTREMDCIDCHNRPTHNYLPPNEALDEKIMTGEIPQDVPYIKRQALDLITRKYDSQQEALTRIAVELRAWYRDNYPDIEVNNDRIAQAILGIQAAYKENVFPQMNVTWGTYTDHIGHGTNSDRGCFRCHDGKHFNSKGDPISNDCNTCHIILARDSKDPDILKTLRGR